MSGITTGGEQILRSTLSMDLITQETPTNITDNVCQNDDDRGDCMIGKVARLLSEYDIYVIAAIGIPGNILALITILQFKQQTITVMHVSVLALADSAALLLSVLRRIIYTFRLVDDWNCGLLLYLVNINMTFASWTVVVMSVERFVAVWFPLRVKLLFNTFRHIMIICSVYLSIAAIYSPLIWSFNYTHDESLDTSKCKQDEKHSATLKVVFSLGAVLYSIMPCILLIVLNSLIIVKARVGQKLQSEITTSQSSLETRIRQQNQMTRMLITVSIIFVILILPNAIWYQAVKPSGRLSNRLRLAKSIILILSYANNAVNFYVCLCVCRKFRDKFRDLIFRMKKNEEHSEIELNENNLKYSVSTNISAISSSSPNVRQCGNTKSVQ